MKPPSLSGIVDVGLDVLNTTVDNSTQRILAQTGDVVGETTDTDGVEWWQHTGFASRPSKVEAGKKAAQGVVLKTSDRDVCVASIDGRGLDLYGNLNYGETCLYAAGETGTAQARVILKQDGSISLFTTDTNTSEGQSVYFRVATDGFRFVAPWGTIKFDRSGFHILHESGASFDLGGIYGVPGFDSAPLNTLTSYVKMQAGTVSAKASGVSLGAGTTKQPLVSTADLLAVLTLVSAAVKAAGPTGPAAATALDAAITQLAPTLGTSIQG